LRFLSVAFGHRHFAPWRGPPNTYCWLQIVSSSAAQSPLPAPPRKLSLGIIFLTLYIDLIGFSIIFPLGPDLINYYLNLDGQTGLLGSILGKTAQLAHALGRDNTYTPVLFGGLVSSVYSILQFVFAPFWGSLSDRLGRRGVLTLTIAGTALGYVLWVVSGSFWLFLLSRVVSGAFSGNLSVATAAVADVTTRAERSRAMGLVGAAFGLGLVTGPAIGGLTASINLLTHHPSLARFGINPFSVPALISLGLCLVNLGWVKLRFKETLSAESRSGSGETRLRNPVRAILSLDNAPVRRINVVAFIYALAFVAMESCLTFLAADRFGYGPRQNTLLLVFLGFCSIVTQGYIVRKVLKHTSEITVLTSGLVFSCIGLICLGAAPYPAWVFVGLAFLAVGTGLVNPSTTGLISLYSGPAEQGRVLGIFRSLGSLARAITPIVAGLIFWSFRGAPVFYLGAALALIALALSRSLPKPQK
jgi:MFS family permease